MGQLVYHHILPNGLVLLAERMEHVRSAAINFLLPAGAAYESAGQFGVASLLAELITRGAGSRNSRELTQALDNLGLDRDESVGTVNMRFWGSTLARNVPAALELYADILLRPHLPEEELAAVQSLSLQELQALEDSPQKKVMVELRRRYYPPPLNQDRYGQAEDIETCTIETVRQFYRQQFRPNGTILSVAGNVEWEPLKAHVETLFGPWEPQSNGDLVPKPHSPHSDHIPKETQQTQIALALASVPLTDDDYYNARAATAVLSGGMSSRLFTEVREKRGLCYSVYATHESFKTIGTLLVYAGTRSERAQETLDVTLHELRRLREGIENDELDRVKAGLKSALILQEESTSARAGAIASDWYYLGRVRSLDELQAKINELNAPAILRYLDRCPVRDVTLVTLGPAPLTLPSL
ncbi:MAG: pitrilysin family protein [Gemmataceae bacterium]|nr:insulinase family protein [Gemmata sp.]MDW8199281.1 pitrilysin family protein [Gemmataceae bacterium]